jgi:hypothetical protein
MMNVNSVGSMEQMRKMDGSGMGQGQGGANGMKDIMQNLSTEDRAVIQEQMSALSQEDKMAVKDQMKQVDATSMSSDEYMETLLSMFDTSTEDTSSNDESSTVVYA